MENIGMSPYYIFAAGETIDWWYIIISGRGVVLFQRNNDVNLYIRDELVFGIDAAFYRCNLKASITINGINFERDNWYLSGGYKVPGRGPHILAITDIFGYTTTITIKAMIEPPEIFGITDGGFYRNVLIDFCDEFLHEALLNGSPVTRGTVLNSSFPDGIYTLQVTDRAGNQTVVKFMLLNAPSFEIVAQFNCGDIAAGVWINIVWNHTGWDLLGHELMSGATLNGLDIKDAAVIYPWVFIPVWTPITDRLESVTAPDGAYTLVVTDVAGNQSSFSFILDNTPPTVAGVTEGAVVSNPTITFSDANGIYSARLHINSNPKGIDITSGITLDNRFADGHHFILVVDNAGNETIISFTLLNTPPYAYVSGTVVQGVLGQKSLQRGNNVGTSVSIIIGKSSPNIAGVTLNGIDVEENSPALYPWVFDAAHVLMSMTAPDGIYNLVVTDIAGNQAVFVIIIDNTPPTVTGVTEGGFVSNPTITFSDANGIRNAYLSGPSFAALEVASGITLGNSFLDGEYALIVTDNAGNVTTINFTLDNTPPTVTGVTNGGTYLAPTITFSDANGIAGATLNGVSFASGTVLDHNFADGEYTLIVTDVAGNQSTVIFTLNNTPVIRFIDRQLQLQVLTDQAWISINNLNLVIENGSNLIVSLNGVEQSTTTINNIPEGRHTISVIGDAGVRITLIFYVDRTPPIIQNISEGARVLGGTLVFSDNGDSFSDNIITGGNIADIILRNNTTNVTTTDINPLQPFVLPTVSGFYTLIVTDRAGNTTTRNFFIYRDPPLIFGARDGGFYAAAVELSFETILGGTVSFVSLNGINRPVTGFTVAEEGRHVVVVRDIAGGNEATITFYIDTSPPRLIFSNISIDGIARNSVTLISASKPLSNLTVTRNGLHIDAEIGMIFRRNGVYVVTAIDESGNISVYEFEVNKGIHPLSVFLGVVVGGLIVGAAAIFGFLKRRKKSLLV